MCIRDRNSPYRYARPSLSADLRNDPQRAYRAAVQQLSLIHISGDKLYWINKDIWSSDVDAERVPVRPFLEYSGTIDYGLTVDPCLLYTSTIPILCLSPT